MQEMSVSEHHVLNVLWGAVSFAEFMKGYNQLPTRMVSVPWWVKHAQTYGEWNVSDVFGTCMDF